MLHHFASQTTQDDSILRVETVCNPLSVNTKGVTESPALPPVLTEAMAAEFLGLSVRTMQKRRFERKDPPYLKIGRSIRYRLLDLNAFIAAHRIDPAQAALN